ncbi:MAG TPA: STAS domain-containing protein [Chlamydiales bacterium]|jgi:anti-sigma B factor antagonist/stage II sporulation protein AA (anti-sigma F factor antagonist)
MTVGLRIVLEEIDRKLVLRLEGRVDGATAPILERKLVHLLEENHLQLLLDFTQVDYLSSAGMRVLLSTTKKLKAKKGHLILFSLTEEVAEIVRLAGFDKILHLCSSEKEALHLI